MIALARDSEFFHYLRDSSATVEVVEGDGRLSLEAERQAREPGWDLLVLDAFSSDAIPAHLLTREAFAINTNRLASDGVIAIHVSNRHLALAALAFRLARSQGLSAAKLRTQFAPRHSSVPSRWVLISQRPQRLEALLLGARATSRSLGLPAQHLAVTHSAGFAVADIPLWTDDYSDLFGILQPSR